MVVPGLIEHQHVGRNRLTVQAQGTQEDMRGKGNPHWGEGFLD